MKAYIFLFLLLFFQSCGGGSFPKEGLRLGVDPDWYAANFGLQTPYVNGYTEDMLLSIAEYSGMRFELMRANSDDLLQGLQQGKYDAILTTLPRYEYHTAKYSFSQNLLDTGPVLIVPYNSKKKELSQMGLSLVGIIQNDPAEMLIAKYPEIIIRKYASIPALLNAVALGEIEGAVLDVIPARNYVSDLYQGVLSIPGKPMNERGIRLVSKKTKQVEAFDQHLRSLQKRKRFEELEKKWGFL